MACALNRPPYDADTIAACLTEITARRALKGELAVPCGLRWKGYYAHDLLRDGLHIDGCRQAAVDMTGVPKDEYEAHAATLKEPIDALFARAQSWEQAVEVGAAQNALNAYQIDLLLGALDRELVRQDFAVAPGCPGCGGE